MRVHRLEIEAIGPFAERVTIDVDALSAEGLFLIHGPTGSGKTSLLDAICFALYADVPGARSKRGLRSDHAAQDAVPRVTLELTAGLRRLRLTRSPEFSRPKKRGTGLLSVQAQVSLEEHLDGRWVGVSTRHDEVADVVKDVLGMGMSQFAKVVLLPQGEFAAFLRSTPDDRREVLERLFDISAFSDVEAWLAQARRDAGGDLERARGRLTSGLARVEDVLADLADPLTPHPVEALPCDPSVGPLLTEILQTLDHRVSTTMAAFDAASIAERAAAESLADGKAVDVLRARGARALSRLDVLAASESEHQLRARVLAEAERAASLAGHVAAHDRAAADEATVRAAAEHSRRALAPSPLASASDHEVDEALDRLHDLDATVADIVRHTQEAAARSQRRESLTSRLRELATAREVAADLVAAAEVERDDLTEQGRQRAAGAGRIAELELLVAGAHDRLALLDAADLDLRRAAGLAPRRTTLREAVVDARTELLDLRQRRLDDMSAELALALTDGDPCPVCGGVEHPHPASAIDPVSAEQLVAAEHRVDEVTTRLRDVEVEIETLTASATTRLATVGGANRDTLEAEVSARTDELSAARADAQAHALITSRLVDVAAALEAQRARLTSTIAQHETTTALLGELDAQHEAAALRVDDLCAAHASCPCATEDAAGHGRLAHLLGEHRSALDALAGATLRAEDSARALDEAVAGAGFSGREQARAALRTPGEVALLRSQVTAHEEDGAAARAVLADPDVSSALAADPVDLEALQAGGGRRLEPRCWPPRRPGTTQPERCVSSSGSCPTSRRHALRWPPPSCMTRAFVTSPTPRAAPARTTRSGCGSPPTCWPLGWRRSRVWPTSGSPSWAVVASSSSTPTSALPAAPAQGSVCGSSTSGPGGCATPRPSRAASPSWRPWPSPSGWPMPCARSPAGSTSARCSSTRASAASTTTASSRCSRCSTGCARAGARSAS